MLADDVLPVLLRHLDHLGVDLHHVGLLLGRATLLQVNPQRGKQLGRGELAQVVDVAGVVGFVGTADALIDSLEFACAPIVNTSGLAIGERVANSPRIGADNGQAFALTMCPSGQIARGINIRVGDNLDAFGLICGTLP